MHSELHFKLKRMGKIISIIEASRRLGVAKQTLRNWIDKGAISVKNVGKACYIDEDNVLALQDTAEDIERERKALEAIRDEQHREYVERMRERTEEKTRRRYLNMMNGAALRSGFFATMVRIMNAYGVLNIREMYILTDYLNGRTLEDIAESYGLSRERVRQIAEKAIRKSNTLTTIDDRLKEAEALKTENRCLRQAVDTLKENIRKYEEYEEPTGEEKAENDVLCELLSMKLIDCPLSVRARNCLKAGRVDRKFTFDKISARVIVPECETVGDLCRLKKSDVMKLRNFGKKTLRELDNFLQENGLTWGMDVDGIFKKYKYLNKK